MIHALPLLLSIAAVPGEGDPAATAQEWLSLDREIEDLAAARQAGTSGLRMGALVRSNYAWIEDELEVLLGPAFEGEDWSGFTLDNVRAWVAGDVGAFTYMFQLEAAGGDAQLLDGYAAWQVHEQMRFTLGQFQPDFLWSSLVPPERLFFILHTDDGQLWNARVLGARVDGRMSRLAWAFSIDNGADAAAQDLAYTGRISYDLTGPGVGRIQGSYGAGRDSSLTVGAGYHTDDGLPGDRDVYALDAQFTRGRLAVWGEWLDYGNFQDPAFIERTPWSASASWMLVPEKYELGVRYQFTDDIGEREAWTFGVNRYIEGHDAKWQLNYVGIGGDVESRSAVALGLTVNL